MGHSQADKARSRERILNEAATQIRDKGLDALSIGSLMQRVELTHGEVSARASRDPDKPVSVNSLVRSYLSRSHRDQPKSGCAIGALISDVGRADSQCRAVMEPHIESFIAKVAETFGDADDSG